MDEAPETAETPAPESKPKRLQLRARVLATTKQRFERYLRFDGSLTNLLERGAAYFEAGRDPGCRA
jgi:hypothetical protein